MCVQRCSDAMSCLLTGTACFSGDAQQSGIHNTAVREIVQSHPVDAWGAP